MCAHKQVLNLRRRQLLEPLYWSPSCNQHICLRVQGGGCMQGGCVVCVSEDTSRDDGFTVGEGKGERSQKKHLGPRDHVRTK